MTKNELAWLIYGSVVRKLNSNATIEEIVSKIEKLLEPLHPINRETFSKWGFIGDQVTEEECWPKIEKE